MIILRVDLKLSSPGADWSFMITKTHHGNKNKKKETNYQLVSVLLWSANTLSLCLCYDNKGWLKSFIPWGWLIHQNNFAHPSNKNERENLKPTFKLDWCRASEGKTVEVPYRGDVTVTMLDVLGGIRSACTYVGAGKLKEMSKRTTFIRFCLKRCFHIWSRNIQFGLNCNFLSAPAVDPRSQ